jgi:hypothetical protein
VARGVTGPRNPLARDTPVPRGDRPTRSTPRADGVVRLASVPLSARWARPTELDRDGSTAMKPEPRLGRPLPTPDVVLVMARRGADVVPLLDRPARSVRRFTAAGVRMADGERFTVAGAVRGPSVTARRGTRGVDTPDELRLDGVLPGLPTARREVGAERFTLGAGMLRRAGVDLGVRTAGDRLGPACGLATRAGERVTGGAAVERPTDVARRDVWALLRTAGALLRNRGVLLRIAGAERGRGAGALLRIDGAERGRGAGALRMAGPRDARGAEWRMAGPAERPRMDGPEDRLRNEGADDRPRDDPPDRLRME